MNSIWNGYLKPVARTIVPATLGIVGTVFLYALIGQGIHWMFGLGTDAAEVIQDSSNFILGISFTGITVLLLLMHSNSREITLAFPTHLFFLPRKTSQILFPILAFKTVVFTIASLLLMGIVLLFPEVFPELNKGLFLEIRDDIALWQATAYIVSAYLFLQALIWSIAWWGVLTSIVILVQNSFF